MLKNATYALNTYGTETPDANADDQPLISLKRQCETTPALVCTRPLPPSPLPPSPIVNITLNIAVKDFQKTSHRRSMMPIVLRRMGVR